jgi:hypothetical protein
LIISVLIKQTLSVSSSQDLPSVADWNWHRLAPLKVWIPLSNILRLWAANPKADMTAWFQHGHSRRNQRLKAANRPGGDDVEIARCPLPRKLLNSLLHNLNRFHVADSCHFLQKSAFLGSWLKKNDFKVRREEFDSQAGEASSAPDIQQPAAQWYTLQACAPMSG